MENLKAYCNHTLSCSAFFLYKLLNTRHGLILVKKLPVQSGKVFIAKTLIAEIADDVDNDLGELVQGKDEDKDEEMAGWVIEMARDEVVGEERRRDGDG